MIGCSKRNDGAEERHAADEIDAAVGVAGRQRRMQVRDTVARVVDDAGAIQELVHETRPRAQPHAVPDERVAEDPRAAGDQRRDVVEYRGFGCEVSGEAVEDAPERDGIVGRAVDSVQRPQGVAPKASRLESREPPRSVVEAVRLKVDERESSETQPASVQAIARADADVGVVRRRQRAVVLDEALGRAAPDSRR